MACTLLIEWKAAAVRDVMCQHHADNIGIPRSYRPSEYKYCVFIKARVVSIEQSFSWSLYIIYLHIIFHGRAPACYCLDYKNVALSIKAKA